MKALAEAAFQFVVTETVKTPRVLLRSKLHYFPYNVIGLGGEMFLLPLKKSDSCHLSAVELSAAELEMHHSDRNSSGKKSCDLLHIYMLIKGSLIKELGCISLQAQSH